MLEKQGLKWFSEHLELMIDYADFCSDIVVRIDKRRKKTCLQPQRPNRIQNADAFYENLFLMFNHEYLCFPTLTSYFCMVLQFLDLSVLEMSS